MRASDARDIPISRYLEHEGIAPTKKRKGGRELWYASPIRADDKTPSFKVDTVLNVWYDHGLAQGGTLIDLVCQLKSVMVSEALAILNATGLGPPTQRGSDAPRLFGTSSTNQTNTAVARGATTPVSAREKEKDDEAPTRTSHLVIHKICSVGHPGLLDYLKLRAIDETIGRHHLRQIHFGPQNATGRFFALGFPCGQGFDARSKFFKGFVGIGKDISIVPGIGSADERRTVTVFESFVDYLSFLTLQQSLTTKSTNSLKDDAIIMHSVALKRRAAKAIRAAKYQAVSLYLDHDDAGRMATKFFMAETGGDITTDASDLYAGYKDLNERLVANREKGRS